MCNPVHSNLSQSTTGSRSARDPGSSGSVRSALPKADFDTQEGYSGVLSHGEDLTARSSPAGSPAANGTQKPFAGRTARQALQPISSRDSAPKSSQGAHTPSSDRTPSATPRAAPVPEGELAVVALTPSHAFNSSSADHPDPDDSRPQSQSQAQARTRPMPRSAIKKGSTKSKRSAGRHRARVSFNLGSMNPEQAGAPLPIE